MERSSTGAARGGPVKAVFDEFRQTYGCRRYARELNDRRHACSVDLVADLMREQGLVAIQPRRYRVTTITDDGDVYPPDLLDRAFTAELPGTRLVGDITYLRTGEGWARAPGASCPWSRAISSASMTRLVRMNQPEVATAAWNQRNWPGTLTQPRPGRWASLPTLLATHML